MNKQEWKGRKKKHGLSPMPWWWIMLVLCSTVLIVVGIIQLFSRAADDRKSREAAEKMRAVYESVTEEPAALTETPGPTEAPTPEPPTPEPTSEPTETPVTTETPTPTPIPRLSEMPYAESRNRKTGASLQKLRQENRDIIGWLKLGHMVDEPVVQSDNIFYMNHDVKKEPNINGTIFLDENVSLKSRPYGLILYGHNMRTGNMFGGLRNYEKASFYRNDPFLTFDTIYEASRYVIFASGIVNVENEKAGSYLDFFGVMSRSIPERNRAIATLKSVSAFSCTVDVQPEDQLMLLVTCVGNDEERRVVAARRIRDGESEEELKRLAGLSR